ncbi:MAG: hypothetical protein C0607_12580 [Azoarcus sp.]|nr:MAG: hypothetical protein C0607_12580 [Azoarcus sp.]
MEVGKPARRRSTHTEEFKQAVLAACRETGASVAGVALANELNANQVRRWMRERGVGAENCRKARCNRRHSSYPRMRAGACRSDA